MLTGGNNPSSKPTTMQPPSTETTSNPITTTQTPRTTKAAPKTSQPPTPLPSSQQPTPPSTKQLTPPSTKQLTSLSTEQPKPLSTTQAPTTTKASPTVTPSCSKYDYNEVLHKSILFYEAQRSDKLPKDNRIPLRGDSALGDKGNGGEDLTGGWYDAGGFVKFNLPMVFSTTLLTWGFIEYKNAYLAAGEHDRMVDSIKWPMDYFIKAHVGKNELYAQVGSI